jgi:hypothetical protein
VIAQIVEQQGRPTVTVNCIVHKLFAVNDSLIQGSRFFTSLHHMGVLVYDEGVPAGHYFAYIDKGDAESKVIKELILGKERPVFGSAG